MIQAQRLSDRSSPNSNRKLGKTLAICFGSSVLLHVGLIVGITHWWQPPIVADEPIEIMVIEPIRDPLAAPINRPASINSPPEAIITKPMITRPIITKSIEPKPIKPKLIAPISAPRPFTAKPTAVTTKLPPSPKLSAALTSVVSPQSKPAAGLKPNTKKSIANSLPPIVAPPFPAEQFRQSKPPSNSAAFKLSTKSASTFTSSPSLLFPANRTPSKLSSTPIVPALITPPIRSINSPVTDSSLTKDVPGIGQKSNSGRNENGQSQKDDRSATSAKMSSSGVGQATTGSSPDLNEDDSKPGTGVDPKANLPAGSSVSQPAAASAANSNGQLKCIENCQITKLQDLQDRDGGKDRLRIRVVIDATGILLSAEITKSSGNPQIDAVVLAGIKQMRFNPPGKTINGIIKANILL